MPLDRMRLGPFKAGDKMECFCGAIITFVVVDDPKFLKELGRKRAIKWWRGEDGTYNCYYDNTGFIPISKAKHEPYDHLSDETV